MSEFEKFDNDKRYKDGFYVAILLVEDMCSEPYLLEKKRSENFFRYASPWVKVDEVILSLMFISDTDACEVAEQRILEIDVEYEEDMEASRKEANEEMRYSDLILGVR